MKEFSGLTPEMRKAGVGHFRGRAPDPITLEWLLAQNADLEKVLRLQYGDDEFPEEWERELQALQAAEITTALKRRDSLKHFYRVWREGLRAVDEGDDAVTTAQAILRRVPLIVELAGHRVSVTSRSYSAMAEIAVHEMAIHQLREDLRRIAGDDAEARRRLRATSLLKRGSRSALRRRLKQLGDLYQRTYQEMELHRQHLYAHALTSHGGPSLDVAADAPAFWLELGPEDDAHLLAALFEVGPGRYQKLGRQPSAKSRARFAERFGFAALFAAWEKEVSLEPAALFDRDLAQTLTEMRASAIEVPDAREA